FESAPQRQLWRARAELALARHEPAQALSIADKLAASLSPGKVAPRVWIVRGEALARLGFPRYSPRGGLAPWCPGRPTAHTTSPGGHTHDTDDREQGHAAAVRPDRKSTRLNSSHVAISYAVF